MPRLFVALYPPPDTVAALAASLARLELPEHRPTPAGQVHLTLLFLGEVERRRLEAVGESVERAAATIGPFELRPERIGPLPERGPARLLAALTDLPGPLVELRRRLVGRLGRPSGRSRAFLPHLTLCRLPRPMVLEGASVPLDLPPFRVEDLRLMESRLQPGGAEHRGLLRVGLQGR